MTLSQTKIFNIFPESLQVSSIAKILSFFIVDTGATTYRRETFGLTDFTLTYQI